MTPFRRLDPSWLSPGTLVGPWKVKGYHAGGSFGAVFVAHAQGAVQGAAACASLSSAFGSQHQRGAGLKHPL